MIDTLPTPTESLSNRPDRSHAQQLIAHAQPAIHLHPAVERRMASARPRLVRIAQLQGVAGDDAEDVAQETLLAAWRGLDSLRDGERFDAWLDGICRNLCRRWLRSHATLAARQQPLAPTLPDGDGATVEADLADPQVFDPDEELTRQELATLLDRALAHLHPSAREPLALRYIAELPTAAVAARLGISTSAVEVRLHRARRELHALLGGVLRGEAEAFGLSMDARSEDDGCRRPTHIWCPLCGTQRLQAEIDWATGLSRYWCAGCGHFAGAGGPELLAGVRGYKPILSRVLATLTEFYTRGLAIGEVLCDCGRVVRVEPRAPDDAPAEAIAELGGWPAVYIHCPICDFHSGADIARLTMDRPETQRFWRAHPRVHTLPPREVETGGVPAIVMRVQSVTDGAWLDLVWARETLQLLAVHGDPAGA
jgi:RNA polymerase sigma-70 factor (ECF subfamily)